MLLFSCQGMSDPATPWNAAHQVLLSSAISWSLLKFMSIESVMPSSHLILHRPLLLLPSIFPSIRVFSDESALRIGWPKYWSFSFNISPSSEHPGYYIYLHFKDYYRLLDEWSKSLDKSCHQNSKFSIWSVGIEAYCYEAYWSIWVFSILIYGWHRVFRFIHCDHIFIYYGSLSYYSLWDIVSSATLLKQMIKSK